MLSFPWLASWRLPTFTRAYLADHLVTVSNPGPLDKIDGPFFFHLLSFPSAPILNPRSKPDWVSPVGR